ncbi:MAG: hypothetical protein EOM59_09965 [Clostridia bacterium]|nr:hypothetical protein [Clostridia bacterium]
MINQKREEQRQLWISRICEIEDSGMSQEDWCKSNKIAYSTLRYWISKLKKEATIDQQETNWLKVDVSPGKNIATLRTCEESGSSNGMNIRFGEFTVELQNGCDPQRIFDILRILKAL